MPERTSKSSHVVSWIFVLAVLVAIAYAGLQFWMPTTREVPTARVERKEFVQTVRTRGEVKSMNTVPIAAPQTPIFRSSGSPLMASRSREEMLSFSSTLRLRRSATWRRSTEVRQV